MSDTEWTIVAVVVAIEVVFIIAWPVFAYLPTAVAELWRDCFGSHTEG